MNIYAAKWINIKTTAQEKAYYYRKVFELDEVPENAELFCAAAGFYEVFINGKPVSDYVLNTPPTQYDYRVEWMSYPIRSLLRKGKNVIVFHLGNGFYNYFEKDHWKLDQATFRDFPRFMAYLEFNGVISVKTDDSWKARASGIVYNSLRNGEFFDANQEPYGLHEADYNDSKWQNAVFCSPPGGKIVPMQGHPCKVFQKIDPVDLKVFTFGRRIYDFGVNISGWCEVTFTAPPGTTIYLEYGEMVNDIGDVDREYINHYGADAPVWQEQRFTVDDSGRLENVRTHFTWFGFRYVRMRAEHPEIKIEKIQACVVHNSYPEIGSYSTSDYMLDKLFELTKRSYDSNYVGLPTDCPHREKAGWHGDLNRGSEVGLYLYDIADDYAHYLDSLVGTQRTNGQIPAAAPNGAWGYHWPCTPCVTLFWVPHQVYRFTGRDDLIRRYYDNMASHLDYCRQKLRDDGLNYDSIGDWCPVEHFRMAGKVFIATLGHYLMLSLMVEFAKLLGKADDEKFFTEQKNEMRANFRKAFYHGGGVVGDDAWTTLAYSLITDMFTEEEGKLIAANLVEKVRANDYKVDYGNIGSKVVHHALSRYGYVEDTYKLLTQPEYPGYGHWVKIGATTLWETWSGLWSRNHIMHGDFLAWFFIYLGGLRPGKGEFLIKPHCVSGLKDFKCYHDIPGKGRISVAWEREENGDIKCQVALTGTLKCLCEIPGVPAEMLQAPVEKNYTIPASAKFEENVPVNYFW